MELTGEELLPLPRERVYDALLDPGLLKAAIPGCESVTRTAEGAYDVVTAIAVGPVKARFKGTLRLENPQRPDGYVMHFEGDGGMAGFARGSAQIALTQADPSQTRLRYVAQAQIGGRLAQIGARLIDATAAKLSAQFFRRLTELLSAPAPVAQPDAVAPATVASAPVALVGPVAAAGAGVPSAAMHVQPEPKPARHMVTLQMPAWTWALTVIVVAALVAYLNSH